jgi:hypothetical protein
MRDAEQLSAVAGVWLTTGLDGRIYRKSMNPARHVGAPVQNSIGRICAVVVAVLFSFGTACPTRAQNNATPIVVPTIAALRSLATDGFTNDTIAYVIDYHEPSYFSYRGGGHFRWRTPRSRITLCCGNVATDDGGRFIACESNMNGFWERIFDGEAPNVKMWGAYGDGQHDDTDAIQNALNGANSYSDGVAQGVGEMFFPAGIYKISRTLVFATGIRGETSGSSIVMMPAGINADMFQSQNAYNALHGGKVDWDHHLKFEDMKLDFAGTDATRNRSNSALVVCQPGEAHVIRNIHIKNGAIGIRCLGTGAPGLKLRDVTVMYAAVAGLCIESVPGTTMGGDPISVIGISGDQHYDDCAATASLILFKDVAISGSISQIKAEGDFGGGVVRYEYPTNRWGFSQMAAVSIDNSSYNAGGTYGGKFHPTDFVVLEGPVSPSITLSGLHLFNVRNLIDDKVTGREVEADIDLFTGLAQQTVQLPLTYQSMGPAAGRHGENSRLVVGQTAISYLYATNTGWYRVMTPLGVGRLYISGRLTLSLPGHESTEIQVDVNPNNLSAPWLNVTRCPAGVNQAIVTRARAFYYPDSKKGDYWGYVDIYVGNPVKNSKWPKLCRMTVALDINGYETFDAGQIELLGQILPVSATLPPGASNTVVNTYR